ncbi:MAG: alpha/beta hydrolase [Patescibacteria group bacterium]
MRVFLKKYLKLLTVSLAIAISILTVVLINQQILYQSIDDAAKARPLNEVANINNDIAYCSTDNKSQTLDLITPKEKIYETNPLIIYVHGGGWNAGDKENSITDEYAAQMAELGIVAASLDYRLSSEAIYPAQNEDITCAINFLVTNAHTYEFDVSKMIIMGDSAGGQLAAMEAIAGNHEYLGVIMAYGVSDLNKQITEEKDKNAVEYLGSKATELAESDSPAFAKSYPDTSFLLIHGTGDSVVPAQESKDFANILRKNGVNVEYVPIPNASHAFLGSGDASDRLARKAMLHFIANLLNS